MTKNTQLYFDVIIEQIKLAGDRLSNEEYTDLLENLNEDIGTRMDAVEIDDEEEEDEE